MVFLSFVKNLILQHKLNSVKCTRAKLYIQQEIFNNSEYIINL